MGARHAAGARGRQNSSMLTLQREGEKKVVLKRNKNPPQKKFQEKSEEKGKEGKVISGSLNAK